MFASIFFINTTGKMTPHLLSMCFPQALIMICIHVSVLCNFFLQYHYVVGINSCGRHRIHCNFKRWPIYTHLH
jgi:hypothetical protein